jgi:hypothetical protein
MTEIGGDCQVVSRPGDGCQVLFQVLLEPEPFLKSFFKSQPPDNGISKIQPSDKHDPLPAK